MRTITGHAVNLRTTRTAVGSLLVVSAGWLLLATIWAHQPFIVSPQPGHLARQLVSMLLG
jgi:hypothetical protein